MHGLRAALIETGGEAALRDVADRLPVDVRMSTVEKVVMPIEWVAVRHLVAWHDALWQGPLARDEDLLARLVARSLDHGLVRFKSAFFVGLTPDRLRDRAAELWRWQHTHGELTADVEGARGIVALRDHPYVGHATSRRVTAESCRAILSLAGAREVRAAWGTENGALVVHLSWR